MYSDLNAPVRLTAWRLLKHRESLVFTLPCIHEFMIQIASHKFVLHLIHVVLYHSVLCIFELLSFCFFFVYFFPFMLLFFLFVYLSLHFTSLVTTFSLHFLLEFSVCSS
jgi:hypothetical protein